jgi:hypothetical protein
LYIKAAMEQSTASVSELPQFSQSTAQHEGKVGSKRLC